jgi:hypothetical protein
MFAATILCRVDQANDIGYATFAGGAVSRSKVRWFTAEPKSDPASDLPDNSKEPKPA